MKNITIFLTLLLGTISSVQAQIPSYIPKDSLVGWWPFNGNANDESGNGNHGNITGATLTSDRYGDTNKSYSFDGIDDYIVCSANKIPTTTSITIMAWLKPFKNNGIAEYICLGSQSNTTWGTLAGTDWNGSPFLNMNYGRGCSGSGTSNIAVSPSPNIWQQITYVSSGDNGICSVYVDGKFIGTSNNGSIGNCTSTNLYFGIDIFGNAEYINCELDDIGIWNRALDSNEIKSMYNGSTANVQNKNSNSKIKVYPNPAKDNLVIDFGNYSSMAGYEINIFDVAGKSVYSSTINKSSETIDLNTWNGKGVYFLKIYDKLNQQIENRKIVIQ